MKRIVMLFTLLSVVAFNSAFSQSLETPERKYYYLKQLESKVWNLPFDIEVIRDSIVPELNIQRHALAPHYPDITSLERTEQARTDAFVSWITAYLSEYNAYHDYLVNYLRNNS